MAWDDPISENQLRMIYGLVRSNELIVDYEGEEDLDELVEPIYGCTVAEMNRGQASMLIDDIKFQLGEGDEPEHESIFV